MEVEVMKVKFIFVAIIAGLLFEMNNSPALAASTPTYLGQTTWTMYITHDTIDPFMVGQSLTLTGGITKMGDNYYSFQAYGPYDTRQMVLSGAGALINGKLILTLSDSQPLPTPTSDRDVGVMNVSLDTAANNYLNGSFSELHFTSVNNNTPFGNGIFAGTLTRTGGAIPLSPAYNASLSLLLE
jgi:hypothetical protein